MAAAPPVTAPYSRSTTGRSAAGMSAPTGTGIRAALTAASAGTSCANWRSRTCPHGPGCRHGCGRGIGEDVLSALRDRVEDGLRGRFWGGLGDVKVPLHVDVDRAGEHGVKPDALPCVEGAKRLGQGERCHLCSGHTPDTECHRPRTRPGGRQRGRVAGAPCPNEPVVALYSAVPTTANSSAALAASLAWGQVNRNGLVSRPMMCSCAAQAVVLRIVKC